MNMESIPKLTIPQKMAPKLKAQDTLLCISPKWRLRNDSQRIITYKYDTEESAWKVLPPMTGLTLSLFDGESSLEEIALTLQELFDSDIEEARLNVEKVVNQFYTGDDPVLVDINEVEDGDWPTYNAENFVIAANQFVRNKRLDAPLNLILMPFNQCGVDCRYCYAERKPIPARRLLTIQRWREIIAEAAQAGVDIAVFSGGDPMLYPDIMELLDVLVEHDFDFLVSTKTKIDRETAFKLSELGLGKRYFQVSLDGATDEMANYMVRRNNYFSEAMESINNLLTAGIRVRTNTVCTSSNFKEAPALVENLLARGVEYCTVTIYGRSLYRHDEALFVDEKDVNWLRDTIGRIADEHPDKKVRFNGAIIDYNLIPQKDKQDRWAQRASCSGGRSSVTICADGRVLLCESMPHADQYTVGNLSESGIVEVWNSERMQQIAFPSMQQFSGTPCENCSEFDRCHKELGYCFRDALNAYGDVYKPPPNCPKAPESPRFA